MPLDFTVLIPTHNRAALIGATLDAVLAQTYAPREIIVIDDGSTDDTPAVLDRYGDRIVRKRISNSGVQAARNIGFGLACSPWVALCDSDDLWLPTYLEKQAALIEAEPGIGMSFGNFRVLQDGAVAAATKFDDAPAGYWEHNIARRTGAGLIMRDGYAEATFVFHPIFPSAMVVSKTLAQSVGGFNGNMPASAEDGEFTLRCLYGAKIAALEEPLVLIRKHAGNASGELVSRLISETSVLRYIRDNHTEAAPYHATIEKQIQIRTAMAFHAAFAAKDHTAVQKLFADLDPKDRSAKALAKFLVARTPKPIALPLNDLLQRLR